MTEGMLSTDEWGILAPFINAYIEGLEYLKIFVIISAVISILINIPALIATGVMFKKAGFPAWAVLVPIYNTIIMSRVIYGNSWMCFLTYIPTIGSLISYKVQYDFAKVFGGSVAMRILSIFFWPITSCILAFGGGRYTQPTKFFP